MKKLYILLLILISLPLIGATQQKENLESHPIVGIWYLEDFDIVFKTNDKKIEDRLNKFIEERKENGLSRMSGSYMVFTEQGTQITIEQSHDLTEFVVEEPFVGKYGISDYSVDIKAKDGTLIETFEYEISDNLLYLTVDSDEARKTLISSSEYESIEGIDTIDFTFEAKIIFKKSEPQPTGLNGHPITCGTWICEDIVYELEVDTDEKEERARLQTLFEESFQDKTAFWNNTFHFAGDGMLYNQTTSPMNYFIVGDSMIKVITSGDKVYSANFAIEDDVLVLTIYDLKEDLNIYATLENGKLPPVKKAAIKMLYRLVK